jgi:hypothetical protein
MKRFATVAMAAAIMSAGTVQAQQPAQRSQAQRPAPQAQGRAAVPVPTRVTAATLTAVCAQDRNACLTYVLGAADAFSSALVAAGRPQVFCFPKGTTNDQIAQRVVAYLRARPQEGGTNAGLVILAGLTASYPCGY